MKEVLYLWMLKCNSLFWKLIRKDFTLWDTFKALWKHVTYSPPYNFYFIFNILFIFLAFWFICSFSCFFSNMTLLFSMIVLSLPFSPHDYLSFKLQHFLEQEFSNTRSHDPTYGNEYNHVNRSVVASLEITPERKIYMWILKWARTGKVFRTLGKG